MPLPVSCLAPLLRLPSVAGGWPGPRFSLPGIWSRALTVVVPCGQGSPLPGAGWRGGGGWVFLLGMSRPVLAQRGGLLGQAAVRRLQECVSFLLPPRWGVGCRGRGVGVRSDAPASAWASLGHPCALPARAVSRLLTASLWPWSVPPPYCSCLCPCASGRQLGATQGASRGMYTAFCHPAASVGGRYSYEVVAVGSRKPRGHRGGGDKGWGLLGIPCLRRIPPVTSLPRFLLWGA